MPDHSYKNTHALRTSVYCDTDQMCRGRDGKKLIINNSVNNQVQEADVPSLHVKVTGQQGVC